MKNKEKYNLAELQFRISSSVNNCGRKIDPKHITITANGEKVLEKATYGNVLEEIMRWLESDGE